MKKKLLITVGAGASIPFGMPSVNGVDAILDAQAARDYPLADDPASNLYRHIRDAIAAYYLQQPKELLRKSVNFEEVLYQVNLLAPYLSDPLFFHGSRALLSAAALPDVLRFGRTPMPVDGHVMSGMASRLMDAIVDEFTSKCSTLVDQKTTELCLLAQLLDRLGEEFDIGVLTLNYDDVMMQARPGLFTGFDDAGLFDPGSVLERQEWGFIYHLHGSIHFSMASRGMDLHEIVWDATPSSGHTRQSSGRSGQDSMEGTNYPTSTIVAGYGKPQQVLRDPFRTYLAQAHRLVHEADAHLFLGYGFGDLHLNAAFKGVRARPRPAVVVSFEADSQDALQNRIDSWSINLAQTLPYDARSMAARGCSATPWIGDLRASNELEVSNDARFPLGVWYGGLLEACRHSDKILANLR